MPRSCAAALLVASFLCADGAPARANGNSLRVKAPAGPARATTCNTARPGVAIPPAAAPLGTRPCRPAHPLPPGAGARAASTPGPTGKEGYRDDSANAWVMWGGEVSVFMNVFLPAG